MLGGGHERLAELFSSSWHFLREPGGGPPLGGDVARATAQSTVSIAVVIVFLRPSAADNSPLTDWATLGAEGIPRTCPECATVSIIGHGRRRKQAHDEEHDWIGIRRGLCKRCLKTVTFLPPFSLPYTHYSLVARSQALQRYFVDGCSLERAVPLVQDPERLPDVTTLRRWFRDLDCPDRWECFHRRLPEWSCPLGPRDATVRTRSGSSFPFLQKMLRTLNEWLSRGPILSYGPWRLSHKTWAHFLQVLLPLRL